MRERVLHAHLSLHPGYQHFFYGTNPIRDSSVISMEHDPVKNKVDFLGNETNGGFPRYFNTFTRFRFPDKRITLRSGVGIADMAARIKTKGDRHGG